MNKKNLRFLQKLNQGNATGYNYTWTLSNKQSTYYKQNQQQLQYEEAIAKTADNVFFGINPTKTPKSPNQRATNADVCRLNALFLDLDGKSEKKPNNPETVEELIKFLDDTILPPPNYIIKSGKRGFHAYYFIKNGFPITDEESRKKAEDLTKGFVKFIQSEGKKLGYHFDSVSDLPRVGRMPGSYNNKTDEPVLVEIIRESEELFSFEELCRFLPEAENPPPSKRRSITSRDKENTSDDMAKFAPIYEGCPFIRESVDNAKSVSEPAWYHSLTIASRCENGRAVCHQISELYPDYNYDETERKIDHALSESGGPTTCQFISEILAFSGCQSCPIKQTGNLTSPIGLGFIQTELARIVSKYVYCLTTNQYFEVGV